MRTWAVMGEWGGGGGLCMFGLGNCKQKKTQLNVQNLHIVTKFCQKERVYKERVLKNKVSCLPSEFSEF